MPSRDQNQRPAKIGRQLALTIDKTTRDGVEVSERADSSQRAGSIQALLSERCSVARNQVLIRRSLEMPPGDFISPDLPIVKSGSLDGVR